MVYNFGMPDVLVGIHFPHGNQGKPLVESLPWYWYLSPPERPYYFQYIGPLAHGFGWQRTQNAPLIKILASDTQTLTPTPVLGFSSLEDAIDNGAPDQAFGRFQFTDDFFWKVMNWPQTHKGQLRPEFQVIQGRPTGTAKQKPPISKAITQTVTKWKNQWNFGASNFNASVASVLPSNADGVAYPFPKTQFAVPLPTATSVPDIAAAAVAGDTYLGPIPGGFWFSGGQVKIYKQAYAFRMNIAQLNFTDWRMDVFPPQRTHPKGDYFTGGFETFDCSGYGLTTFPLAGPQIIGI